MQVKVKRLTFYKSANTILFVRLAFTIKKIIIENIIAESAIIIAMMYHFTKRLKIINLSEYLIKSLSCYEIINLRSFSRYKIEVILTSY